MTPGMAAASQSERERLVLRERERETDRQTERGSNRQTLNGDAARWNRTDVQFGDCTAAAAVALRIRFWCCGAARCQLWPRFQSQITFWYVSGTVGSRIGARRHGNRVSIYATHIDERTDGRTNGWRCKGVVDLSTYDRCGRPQTAAFFILGHTPLTCTPVN